MTTGNPDREHASKGAGPKGHGEKHTRDEKPPRAEGPDHGARHGADVTPPQEGTSNHGSAEDTAHADQPGHCKRHKHSRKDLEHRTEELAAEIERLKVQITETQDKYLRALADFDNYRKRVARENDERTRCANEDLIARLLEVVDNMERAFDAAEGAKDFEALRKGLELTFLRLKEILTREGLCPIECVGEKFDPNYHEAVMAVEREGTESENVIEEIQKGYMLKGKVIRPSKVVVSK